MNNTKKSAFHMALKTLPQFFSLLYKNDKKYLFLMLLETAAFSIDKYPALLIMKYSVDALTDHIVYWEYVRTVIPLIAIMLTLKMLRVIVNTTRPFRDQVITENLFNAFFAKCMKMDYQTLENKEMQDKKELAKYITEGYAWGALLRLMPKLIAQTKVFFCVDTLEFLQKGGRIGKIAAVAGTLLQIKPIISFAPNGELINEAKARGSKLAMEKMVQMVRDYYPGHGQYNIAVAHGGAPAALKQIKTAMQTQFPDYLDCLEGEIDCTLGAYVGPRLLGAAIQILPDI